MSWFVLVIQLVIGLWALLFIGAMLFVSKKSKDPNRTMRFLTFLILIVTWLPMIYDAWTTNMSPPMLYVYPLLFVLVGSGLRKKSIH